MNAFEPSTGPTRGILRFLGRLTVFVGLQVTLILAFTDWRLDDETSYLAATLDKHRRAGDCAPPRIFLVGGSSVVFSFDSPRLEEAFGRPVVNLALTAGLGIDFFLNEVQGLARAGDWIVLSPEYSTWHGGYDRGAIRQLLECSPGLLTAFPWRVQLQMVDQHGLGIMGGWLRRAVGLRTPLPDQPDEPLHYRRSRLNRQGDYVGHFGLGTPFADLPEQNPWRQSARLQPVQPRVLDHLQRFVAGCEQRGIRVFHTCPPHPTDLFQLEQGMIQANFVSLEKIRGLMLLDRPEDNTFPPGSFYDTRYHLTREGTVLRTDRVVAALSRVTDPAQP